MGSTRVARRAGMKQASRATNPSKAATPAKVSGSVAQGGARHLLGRARGRYAALRYLWGEGEGDENTWEFVCSSGDIDCGGGYGGTASGRSSGECAAGPVAGGESGKRVCEIGSGAIREEHGGGGGGDAGGEVWLQAFAGDEFVRAPGDAHRTIEQYLLREDFRADGAGREDCGDGSERQTGGSGEGFLCVLHGGAGEGGRFETGRAIRDVRQPADLAGRSAGGAGRQLDRPLCDAGDLFAAEWNFAADGP